MRRAGINDPMASPRPCATGSSSAPPAITSPPNLIQRWMGHASPTTTAIYLDAVGIEER